MLPLSSVYTPRTMLWGVKSTNHGFYRFIHPIAMCGFHKLRRRRFEMSPRKKKHTFWTRWKDSFWVNRESGMVVEWGSRLVVGCQCKNSTHSPFTQHVAVICRIYIGDMKGRKKKRFLPDLLGGGPYIKDNAIWGVSCASCPWVDLASFLAASFFICTIIWLCAHSTHIHKQNTWHHPFPAPVLT